MKYFKRKKTCIFTSLIGTLRTQYTSVLKHARDTSDPVPKYLKTSDGQLTKIF